MLSNPTETTYSDEDVTIVVTHPDDSPVYIVVEKPAEGYPDLRFHRHIINFYVLEDDPENEGEYLIRSDFSVQEYTISLTVGMRKDESGMVLHFWDETNKKLVDLEQYVGSGNYTVEGGYAEVVINKKWADPTMGWRPARA